MDVQGLRFEVWYVGKCQWIVQDRKMNCPVRYMDTETEKETTIYRVEYQARQVADLLNDLLGWRGW